MCERCNNERDEAYEGSSIEEKRRKATRAICDRHPELGIDPSEITYRFAPKAQHRCVRINYAGTGPRYEVRVPKSMGNAMAGGPTLHGIAMAACIATDRSFPDACEILGIAPFAPFDALFVSPEPPVDPTYPEGKRDVRAFEERANRGDKQSPES